MFHLNKLVSNEDKGLEISDTEATSKAGVVPKKSVRFQLPDENPLERSEGSPGKGGLEEIKQLLLEVLGRQRRMEEDIKILKSTIKKSSLLNLSAKGFQEEKKKR